jgi:hypothetical protein
LKGIDDSMMKSRKFSLAWCYKGLCKALVVGHFLLANHSLSAQIVPAGATSPGDQWQYADVADVFSDGPIIARIKVRDAIAIKGASARPASIRMYFSGEITSLIRAPSAIAPRITWLADVPVDARGRAPKLKKRDMLMAVTIATSPNGSSNTAPPASAPASTNAVRLITRDAMVPWSPALEARIRALSAELTRTDAVPAITGITNAFHTPGAVPGEGETQIFLSTPSEQIMSISILRRPGEPARWAFAPTEIIDDAATMPARDTLGWYRLACFLPQSLPEAATVDLSANDAATAREDYALVMASLGQCPRTRPAS